MDIAAMSTMLSQAKVKQQVGVSTLKIAMDTGQTQMNEMLKMVEQSTVTLEQLATPHVGKGIDIRL